MTFYSLLSKGYLAKLSRYITLSFATIVIAVGFNTAGPFAQEYRDITYRELTNFVLDQQQFNLGHKQLFNEYVITEACEFYRRFANDDFQWRRLQKAFAETQQERLIDGKIVRRLRARIPLSMLLTNYNFETSSFDILPRERFEGVNSLALNDPDQPICDGDYRPSSFSVLPRIYQLRLDTPLNLRRIPISPKIGRKILSELERDSQGYRRIFLDILVTVDGVESIGPARRGINAVLRGRIDQINFFTDVMRQNQIKSLFFEDFIIDSQPDEPRILPVDPPEQTTVTPRRESAEPQQPQPSAIPSQENTSASENNRESDALPDASADITTTDDDLSDINAVLSPDSEVATEGDAPPSPSPAVALPPQPSEALDTGAGALETPAPSSSSPPPRNNR